ncbi:MAG: arginine deiminase [Candidatus Xenobia bacterium]
MQGAQFPLLSLAVGSEVGRLRAVMVHRPGPEIDRMAPSMRSEYLFDDILYGDKARAEHDQFQAVLRLVADEVLDVQDLLADALLDDSVRACFVEDLARLEGLSARTATSLADLDRRELALVAIRGLEHPEQMMARVASEDLPYLLHPLPNLLFIRDPLCVVGNGAVLASMARGTRQREPLIMKYAYGFHPRLRLQEKHSFLFDELALLSLRRRIDVQGLEGGDILVLSERVLAIGVSERTSEVAIDLLAEALMGRTPVETILVVLLPRRRAFMHLDTVFTQVSEHECLVYPPMFLPDGAELLPCIKKGLRGEYVRSELKPSLLEALREEGIELEPLCCGGPDDRIAQQREQWTDGANALALAPGVVTLYERNVRTAEELARHAYQVVTAEELTGGHTTLTLDGKQKYAIMLIGTELSRARGGPRCMSMPLVREPV